MMKTIRSSSGTDGVRSGPLVYYVLAHEQFQVPELVDCGAASEAAGFDGVWTSDHFQPWQDNEGHSGLAWLTLAALSQRTKQLVLGTGVTCPSFRYLPTIVAQAWATLGQLAPGRVFLGVGSGEMLNEGAAGGGWADYKERTLRLVEAVNVIRHLWTGEPLAFEGRFWKVRAKLYDAPSSSIPIYIAAGGPKSARLAGRHGDGLITGASSLKEDNAIRTGWEEGLRESGRTPGTLPVLVEHWAIVGGDSEAREAAQKWRFTPKVWESGFYDNIDPRDIQRRAEVEIPLETVYRSWTVSEDPEEHVRAIRELATAGASHVAVHVATPDQFKVIDFFGKKVLPVIHRG